MLAHLKFDGKDQKEISKTPSIQHIYKGITKVQSLDEQSAIAVGSTLGNIYFIKPKGNNKFGLPFFGIKLGNPINCLTCSDEEGVMVAGDIMGFIHFIQLPKLKKAKLIM